MGIINNKKENIMLQNKNFTRNQLISLAALINFSNEHNLDLDDVMEISYNSNSGYVYIAFEDGITIAIFEGRSNFDQINFYSYDNQLEEEVEYDTIQDCIEDVRLCEL